MLTDTNITSLHTWCATQPFQLGVLFGSQATGRARPDSDVDIAIWPSESFDPLQKLVWIGQLETLLQREVSLVIVTRKLDPLLGYEITKHGRFYSTKPPQTNGARNGCIGGINTMIRLPCGGRPSKYSAILRPRYVPNRAESPPHTSLG